MRLFVGGNRNPGCWPRRWLLAAVLAGCLAGAASAQAQPFVYVANADTGTVSQYDAMGGPLSPLVPPALTVTIPGATITFPHGVAVTPDGKSVYVADSAAPMSGVSQFDVGAGGALTPKTPATVPAGIGTGEEVRGIAVSPDGKSVYVVGAPSSGIRGVVFQYDVGVGGTLTPKTPDTVPTANDPEGIAVSADGKSVYVTNRAPAVVSQFDVGPDGALTPKTPATVPAVIGPVGVAVSPDGRSVYVTNTFDTSISQYNVGVGGALTPKTPATVATLGSPEDVAVSPDGKSVYVTDENSDTVSQYNVGAGGALTPKSPAAVGAGSFPRGVAVSPDGKNVYVTESNDGTISQYDVGAGGALTPKTPATVPAGIGAEGIAVTPLARLPTSKDQCKNRGWRNYGSKFKNQGQCVAFVVTQALQKCLTERAKIGLVAFRNKYGLGRYHVLALLRCVNQASR